MTMCTLITYIRNIDYMYLVPIIVVLRLAYASGVCWILVACAKGHGGWFTTVTSLPVFVHINKLSYGIYLFNPIVISFIYGSSSNSTTIDPIIQVKRPTFWSPIVKKTCLKKNLSFRQQWPLALYLLCTFYRLPDHFCSRFPTPSCRRKFCEVVQKWKSLKQCHLLLYTPYTPDT